MKILILIISLFILTSCFWPDKWDIESAKNELLWKNDNNENSRINYEDINEKEDITNDDIEKNNIKENKVINNTDNTKNNNIDDKLFNVKYFDDNNYLKIIDIDNSSIKKEWVEIRWEVLNKDIDKIKVYFSNKTSDLADWDYTLKKYKKWDSTFLYNAFRKFNAFDNWENNYLIEWYIWNRIVSKINVSIKYPDDNLIEKEIIDKNLFEEVFIDDFSFPEWESIWFLVDLWNKNYWYSKLDNFTIKIDSNKNDLNCSNIWDLLKQNYSWYFWNNCLEDKNKLSVNVLYLIWNKYYYETRYFHNKYPLSWRVLLETWFGITWENISQKNLELKDVEFENQKITNIIFNNIKRINE